MAEQRAAGRMLLLVAACSPCLVAGSYLTENGDQVGAAERRGPDGGEEILSVTRCRGAVAVSGLDDDRERELDDEGSRRLGSVVEP